MFDDPNRCQRAAFRSAEGSVAFKSGMAADDSLVVEATIACGAPDVGSSASSAVGRQMPNADFERRLQYVFRKHFSLTTIMRTRLLKIIGGEYGSRQLYTPPDKKHTRPYSGRVREAVFNLLRGWFEDANVVDLFAGVGSMGLEAVSRGAAHVLLVEHDRQIFKLLKENIKTLNCAERAHAIMGDALGTACLHVAPRPVHIMFVDPPYDMIRQSGGRKRVFAQIKRAREVLDPHGFVVLRTPLGPSDDEPMTIEAFDGPEVHQYGKDMFVLLYQPGDEAV